MSGYSHLDHFPFRQVLFSQPRGQHFASAGQIAYNATILNFIMAPRPIDSDSSDDDAPEAVTLTQSKTAARERSKAITQHHAELNEKKREKNRRRDQQLKEQAKDRKPSRTGKDESDEDEGSDDGADAAAIARMEKAMREAEKESDEEGDLDEDEDEDEDEKMLGEDDEDDSSEASEDEVVFPSNPNHLPDHFFTSAFASSSRPSKADAKKDADKSAGKKEKKRRRPKSGAKDIVLGCVVDRPSPRPLDSPSPFSARTFRVNSSGPKHPSAAATVPSAKVRKFVDRSLALKGSAARTRGWERRPGAFVSAAYSYAN